MYAALESAEVYRPCNQTGEFGPRRLIPEIFSPSIIPRSRTSGVLDEWTFGVVYLSGSVAAK